MNKHTELTAKIEELMGDLEEDAIFEFERDLFQTFSDALTELRRLAEIERKYNEIMAKDPVGWQFFQDGKWFNGTDHKDHYKNTKDAGYPVRGLYTLPKDEK